MAFVTVTQTLEKWFRKPLSKLPHEEQKIAMAYIKAWDTLTPILRRERAKEIDRQRAVKLRIKHDSIRRQQKLDLASADPVEVMAWVHAGYYGEAHVRMWLSMGSVSTQDAALLFHGENPSSYKGYDMGSDFNDMKKSFDDVEGKRNLAGWIAVARQRNLQAVCVEGWSACAKLFAQDGSNKSTESIGMAGPLATFDIVNSSAPIEIPLEHQIALPDGLGLEVQSAPFTEIGAHEDQSDELPNPLTTNEIANCFAGLRDWDAARWKDELGSPDKWLVVCRKTQGTRGRRGFESTWLPVEIGASLVRMGKETARTVSKRFKSQDLLKQWIDAWSSYDPEYF
jgi:hypothetical protein